MKFKLVIVAGEGLRNEVELAPPVVIGRSRSADVTIGHPLVSRRHCEITQGDDNLLIVEDLGSLNGTYVGDVRIQEPVYLEPGDYLTVGAITFQALYGDHTEPDFPDDSNGSLTEPMPRLNPPASTPPAEPADPVESMFLDDEPPAPEGEAGELPNPEDNAPQASSESEQANSESEQDAPASEAAEAEKKGDDSPVFEEKPAPEGQKDSGSLSWLTGSGKGEGAKGKGGLDDFFKEL